MPEVVVIHGATSLAITALSCGALGIIIGWELGHRDGRRNAERDR